MHAIKEACGGSGKLHVAHLNHGLRGGEADADEAWLARLCSGLGLPLETAKADVASLAAELGDGFEAAARKKRYEFLQKTAERWGARFVATAHTADDQVETVLQRIVRGTGLAGLAGIPCCRRLSESVVLERPMLSIWRHNVIEYLRRLGQDFRVDSTNVDARYTRNRLRHQLLPLLREEFNSAVDESILRLAKQAAETQQYLARCVLKLPENVYR